MSADNYLVIRKEGKRKFVVYEECASVDAFYDNPLASLPDAELALDFASDYCQENLVEYGIRYMKEK